MRELSLFSGAGGGLLGTKLLGWRHCGYVEYNDYCQRVIRQRIEDGILNEAPIFGDIRTFVGEGYAESYQGMVNVVTAGFPCQGWSTAARGENKECRDIWSETFTTIGIIQPEEVFIENVQRKAIERAGRDLHTMGYTCVAIALSAYDVGADHLRKRFWLRAYANNKGKLHCKDNAKVAELPELYPSVWEAYSGIGRVSDGVSGRVDRYRAIGNGQVPAVAATAWRLLN